MALVAALALMALSAALLAASFVSATALARATRSATAAARADAGARYALATLGTTWSPSFDSVAVGAVVELPPLADTTAVGPPVLTRRWMRRSAARIFVASVEARVGDGPATLARRRYRVVLERPASDTGAVLAPPRPLRRWSFAELF